MIYQNKKLLLTRTELLFTYVWENVIIIPLCSNNILPISVKKNKITRKKKVNGKEK